MSARPSDLNYKIKRTVKNRLSSRSRKVTPCGIARSLRCILCPLNTIGFTNKMAYNK